MRDFRRVTLFVIGAAVVTTLVRAEPDLATTNSASGQVAMFASPPTGIWQGAVGEGFRSSVQTLSLQAGATAGFQAFGGQQDHDLALVSLSYGHMVGPVMGEDHWYRGNWEIRGELFGGKQYSPSSNWMVGLTPHLRYDIATGTRWIPYVDGGAGVTATGIEPPDLSGIFEFNLQANAGVHWFIRDNLALTIQAGFLHVSCAGIHYPNQGLNCTTGMVGLTWFF